jgi:hypothetical protein
MSWDAKTYVLAKTGKHEPEKGVTKRDVMPKKEILVYESTKLHTEAQLSTRMAQRDRMRGILV